MQSNTITLSVDVDNDGGSTAAVDKVFTRFDEYQNRSEYISGDHSLAARDKLSLYRTLPKTAGNFKGVAKSAVKFTQDYSVEGVDSTTTNVAPGIVDINFSFPVGMTPAQTLEMRMRAVALLLDDDVMAPLCDTLMV
jgi:hypothetical protein